MVTQDDKGIEEKIREDYYKKRSTYRKLAKKYRKSIRDISKIIKGKETKVKMEEDLKPQINNLMRGLGAPTPKEALERAYSLVVKLNPYLIYYKIRDPSNLITHLENRIIELDNNLKEKVSELKELEDKEKLATRLRITDETFTWHDIYVQELGYEGNIVEFLNEAVEGYMLELGLCLRKEFYREADGEIIKRFVVTKPDQFNYSY